MSRSLHVRGAENTNFIMLLGCQQMITKPFDDNKVATNKLSFAALDGTAGAVIT